MIPPSPALRPEQGTTARISGVVGSLEDCGQANAQDLRELNRYIQNDAPFATVVYGIFGFNRDIFTMVIRQDREPPPVYKRRLNDT